jgi:hypothetical protein
VLDDMTATDPVRVARRIGTELAPEARKHLQAALEGRGSLGDETHDALRQALQCIELLEAQVHQLETALESRIVIEQAKGVLAARAGEPVEAAFEVLRKRSQLQNRKLREIAGEIVASVGVDAGSGERVG